MREIKSRLYTVTYLGFTQQRATAHGSGDGSPPGGLGPVASPGFNARRGMNLRDNNFRVKHKILCNSVNEQ